MTANNASAGLPTSIGGSRRDDFRALQAPAPPVCVTVEPQGVAIAAVDSGELADSARRTDAA